MPRSTLIFRNKLKNNNVIVMVGAHDALSGKMIEKAGFDAIWASSFGISASYLGMCDNGLITMKEHLEVTRNIINSVEIPVIADCSEGYGNAINVIRTVQEYERIGAAGICLEDNAFPKICSLYSTKKRYLVSIEEFVKKIKAAKDTRKDKNFFIIARTESLIAGLGVDEAVKRAEAYSKAGADAIFVHSKDPTFKELRCFLKKYHHNCPNVVAPTCFPSISIDELVDAGYRIIIFANQLLRASITAMKNALKIIKKSSSTKFLISQIASLDEVSELTDKKTYDKNKKLYLSF